MPVFRDAAPELADALGQLPAGSTVAEVATRLLDLFIGGSLAPGTRLPPERQLAASLHVGRSAVREALAALELLGMVEVRPGAGSYLRGTASELLPQSLRWGLLLGDRDIDDLLEVRGALEIYAARVGAQRLSAPAIEELGVQVDAMRAAGDDFDRFVEADLAFHHALAAACGNAALLDILGLLRSLLRVWSERAVHSREEADKAIIEHAAVHAAIRTGDSDAAASAMAAHMASAAARLRMAAGPQRSAAVQ